MANQGMQNTSSVGTRSFDKDQVQDINDYHLSPNSWINARNAINNSKTGDLGKIGNEPANSLCITTIPTECPNVVPNSSPYTILGAIQLTGPYWALFSTSQDYSPTGVTISGSSEIGIYNEDLCTYTTAVNDPCLGFSKYNLIKGVSRYFQAYCYYKVYWDDGNNPSRVINLTIDLDSSGNPSLNQWTNPNSPITFIQNCTTTSCITCVNTCNLDCNLIRLERLIQLPCSIVSKGASAGTLLNGSYFVSIAYSIFGQKVSDWYSSNIQALFSHENAGGSLHVDLSNLDTTFDEIQVVIVSIVNQQAVARLAGIYNTHQTSLSFDTIDNTWSIIPLEQIPLMTPIDSKSDAMFNVNDYLIRIAPTSKQDFNYQPLANQIRTRWASVQYPTNYYHNGGSNTNYLRDEIYTFFIRFVFDTGDKSSSYHIPGRPPSINNLSGYGPEIINTSGVYSANLITGSDVYETGSVPLWNVYNTAFPDAPFTPYNLSDGGIVTRTGYMGYWESSELYPDDKPQIWNANSNPLAPGFNAPISQYNAGIGGLAPMSDPNYSPLDLCGRPIRHHKFPENATDISCQYLDSTSQYIQILGVIFDNIKAPVKDDGITPIPGIVGYEILRGSRNGNKTILAKGIINNMRLYNPEPVGSGGSRQYMFPNYPYNDQNPDRFLSNTQTSTPISDPFLPSSSSGYPAESGYIPQGFGLGPLVNGSSLTNFTFHSPDTNFTRPFLSAKELKIYGEINGAVTGKFEISEKHPKEKLITNMTFVISAIAGIGLASIAMNGKKQTHYYPPRYQGYSKDPESEWDLAAGSGGNFPNLLELPPDGALDGMGSQPNFYDRFIVDGFNAADPIALAAYNLSVSGGTLLLQNLTGIVNFGDGDIPYDILSTAQNQALDPALGSKAYSTNNPEYYQDDGVSQNIPGLLRIFTSIPIFFNYFTEGTDSVLRLIKDIVRYRDFGLRYHSHCFYDSYVKPVTGNIRKLINNEEYIGPQITDFGTTSRINNLYRINTVAIETNSFVNPTIINDVSRVLASDVTSLYDPDLFGNNRLVTPNKYQFDNTSTFQNITPGNAGIQRASSHYVALKQPIDNLYGQINGIIQVPASYCSFPSPTIGTTASSEVIFGGDTYIGRYTEKNTFYFFYDWLYNQPDGAQLNYLSHRMLPFPRFWANFEGFETSDFTTNMVGAIASIVHSPTSPSTTYILPYQFYHLDGFNYYGGFDSFENIRFSVRDAWFYLFSSGIRDFYVESEINIALRDWGDQDTEQYYDPFRYTDTKEIFNTAIIKAGNYYKYDQSLSISKLPTNYFSWAASQLIEYDPYIAETCWVYSPNKIIYSLPVTSEEALRDNWTIFLANNYYNFLGKVRDIKAVNKSGAVILFDSLSPIEFQGLDQLQTTGGTKLTIGDGGLFSQPMQNVVSADRPYEYGSCQDRLSVINTPVGLFWINQNQGKIFNLAGGLNEISMQDLKWWFLQYLPYQLTQTFPTFNLTDNPVAGIGCQAIFDNENQILYFTKRDFIVKPGIPDTITYVSNDQFLVNGNLPITLGDPNYFEDASWTVSYDPKVKGWISFHDWHPNLVIPSKSTFMTVQNNTVWSHNQRCDLYCNYYGVDYPFEIQYMVNTVQQVNTLRSIEYQMEAYKYDTNCYDRFHILDYNFDQATIYNTEQVSGLLNLVPTPRLKPFQQILYPIINTSSIDILCSKVENKYRFNMFWDVTDDRGEYNLAAQRMIWNTAANGYVKTLNPTNLNYAKSPFQRKKFRHYTNSILLRKLVSGNVKMLLNLVDNKNLMSER